MSNMGKLRWSLTSSAHRPEVKRDIVRRIVISAYELRHACLSLHIWMWLALYGFVWNLMLGLMLKSIDG
jgi:hypothetical protein